MSAHRYWRLNFIMCNGGSAASNYVALAELQLCTADTVNRCGSGTPSASSNFSTNTPSLAFDGNAATWWATNAGNNPSWLAYDFGAGNAWDIQQVVLTARNDASWTTQSPTMFYVQYSDDGSTWTNYWSVMQSQPVAWTQGLAQTFVPVTASAVRHTGGREATFMSGVPTTGGAVERRAATPGPKTVSGTVQVNGTPTAGLLVRAYAKLTGEMIGQATTASDGTFSIKCGANWADVEVMAFDPNTFQALVYDRVTPA